MMHVLVTVQEIERGLVLHGAVVVTLGDMVAVQAGGVTGVMTRAWSEGAVLILLRLALVDALHLFGVVMAVVDRHLGLESGALEEVALDGAGTKFSYHRQHHLSQLDLESELAQVGFFIIYSSDKAEIAYLHMIHHIE